MYEMKRRTEMHPLLGVNDRHELLTFCQREYCELEGFVRRFRVRRTENSYNSYASFIAAERECNNSICGCDPLPELWPHGVVEGYRDVARASPGDDAQHLTHKTAHEGEHGRNRHQRAP